MPRGTSIRIFLADGAPDGLRLVSKSQWTGLLLVASRADYRERLRPRPELAGPGVYLLLGPGSAEDLQAIYVGEADVIRSRLDTHAAGDRDFWDTIVVIATSDSSLNKAHVRYLEARLIALAVTSGRARLENGNSGAPTQLSEADKEDMESFLEELSVLLPAVGVRAFLPTPAPAPKATRLVLRGRLTEGSGFVTSDGFLVEEGSVGRLDPVPSWDERSRLVRARLINDGVLVEDGEHVRLTRPHVFTSPSLAAGVLLARPVNGRIEWKDASGRTLKDLQSEGLPTVIADPPH